MKFEATAVLKPDLRRQEEALKARELILNALEILQKLDKDEAGK